MCNKCGCQNPWRGAGPEPISTIEAEIIARSIDNALCWGTGFISTCQENLMDLGFEWAEHHEHHIFKHYVEEKKI